MAGTLYIRYESGDSRSLTCSPKDTLGSVRTRLGDSLSGAAKLSFLGKEYTTETTLGELDLPKLDAAAADYPIDVSLK
jgi:hypothetical protein